MAAFTTDVYYNDNCDISDGNDISEPVLNPALDPSDCFILTDRLGKGITLDVVGNISVNPYFSQSDMMGEIQTNLMVARLYDTTYRPVCDRERRPVFESQKDRLRFVKWQLQRGQA
jgi:hypothetical protein